MMFWIVMMMCCDAIMLAGCFSSGTPVWNIVNSTCQHTEDVHSKLDALAPCAAMPISQNDLLISVAGNYCLMQDVTGTVTVATSYVHIDLNGHTITGGLNGVLIDPNVHDVSVANGVIQQTMQEGILVQSGCSRIALSDLTVTGCALNTDRYAIDFVGSVADRITNALVSVVTVDGAPNGIRISNGDNNRMSGCRVLNLMNVNSCSGIVLEGDVTQAMQANVLNECVVSNLTSQTSSVTGISLQRTQNTKIMNVQVSVLTGSAFVVAVFAQSGLGNLFDRCILRDISSTNLGGFGTGGFLLLSETDCRLQGCSVADISAQENVGGYGLVGVQGGYVSDCSVTDLGTSGVGNFATGYSVSTAGSGVENVYLENISAQLIQAPSGFAVGVGVTSGARNVSIMHASVQDVLGGMQAVGYVAQQSSLISFEDCSALNMIDPSAASGFVLSQVSCCDLKSCSSTRMSSTGGSAVGYYIINGNKCVFDNCSSLCASSVGGVAAGFFMLSSSAMAFLGCEANYNDAQNSAVGVFGFVNSGSNDVIYDYCLTQSNSLDSASTGLAYGFNLSDCSDVQILNSRSLMNDDMAFFINTSASTCLINNCVGAQSGQGFTDLGMTSTFIENLASFNGSPFSTDNNYAGIPFDIIGLPGTPLAVGINISA